LNIAEKIKNMAQDLDGMPRKALLIAAVLAACGVLILITPYCLPFMLALIITIVMRPLADLLMKVFSRLHMGRKAAALAAMVLVYGLLALLLFLLARQLARELKNLATSLPGVLAWASNVLEGWMDRFSSAAAADPALSNMFSTALENVGQSIITLTKGLAENVTGIVASGAWGTATSVPRTLLFIVMTIMASFYFTSDMPRIQAFLKKSLPGKLMEQGASIKHTVAGALAGQIRSQLFISFLVTLVMILGMLILRLPYALLLGLLIGIADALPILGAGLFLLPWSLFNFFAGNTPLGIGLLLLYVAVVITRQVVEPRIVGKRLGLYPLVSMFSMYMGFVSIGYLGLLAGPIIANVCKVVLEADTKARAPVPAQAPTADEAQ
jgi:sporulation integral membrane protein YtvI